MARRRLKTQPAGRAGRCADTAVGLRECGCVGGHGVIEEWGVGWCDVPMYLHDLFFLCFFDRLVPALSVWRVRQDLPATCCEGDSSPASAVREGGLRRHGRPWTGCHACWCGWSPETQRCTPYRHPGHGYCRTQHISLGNVATNGLTLSQHAGLRPRVISAQSTLHCAYRRPSRRRRWCCRCS